MVKKSVYLPKLKSRLKLKQKVFKSRFLVKKLGVNFSKEAVLRNEYNIFLKKSFELSPFLEELLLNKAFVGDFYRKTHYSQESLILGYKNKYSFYNIYSVLKLLTKALTFIKSLLKNKKTRFVFVGCPLKAEKSCSLLFRNLNIPFFSNDSWRPGFFSKKKSRYEVVLVIYNPTLNNIAFSEALNKNIPIVGFATPCCDIRGLDYPVILNLENSEIWYASFWRVLLNKKTKG